MARYIQNIELDQPLDVVSEIMDHYIYKNRYIRTDWQGEPAYLSTDSAEGGSRYFKWSYTSGVMHIEAWIKGTFGQESDLNGGGKKQAYRESIERLINSLKNPPCDEYSRSFSNPAQQGYAQSQNTAYTGQSYAQPQSSVYARQSYTQPQSSVYAGQGYAQPQSSVYTGQSYTQFQSSYPQPTGAAQSQNGSQPVYTQQWMNGAGGMPAPIFPGRPGNIVQETPAGIADNAFKYSLLAFFLSIVFPMFGIILGIISIQKSSRAKKVAPEDPKAKASRVFSILALVIAIGMLLGSFFLPMLLMMFSFI